MFPTVSGKQDEASQGIKIVTKRRSERLKNRLTDEHPDDHLLGHTHLHPSATIVRKKDRFVSSE